MMVMMSAPIGHEVIGHGRGRHDLTECMLLHVHVLLLLLLLLKNVLLRELCAIVVHRCRIQVSSI